MQILSWLTRMVSRRSWTIGRGYTRRHHANWVTVEARILGYYFVCINYLENFSVIVWGLPNLLAEVGFDAKSAKAVLKDFGDQYRCAQNLFRADLVFNPDPNVARFLLYILQA